MRQREGTEITETEEKRREQEKGTSPCAQTKIETAYRDPVIFFFLVVYRQNINHLQRKKINTKRISFVRGKCRGLPRF